MQPCPLSLKTWSFVLASFSKRLLQLDLFNQGRFRRTKNFGGRCCHRLLSAAEIGSTNVLADSTKEWLVQLKTRTIFSVAAVKVSCLWILLKMFQCGAVLWTLQPEQLNPRSFRSLWSILYLMAGAKTNHPLREAVLPAGI